MPAGDTAEININDLIVREVKLRPIFRYNNTFPTGVSLLASGRVDVKPLISKRFSLDEVPQAFEYVVENRETCVKAIVDISG
jgi:threonine dehydrogenase-like Zn-dependent dehydrogenase